MLGLSLLTVVISIANFPPGFSQGFQPIVHYVLTPVELFRIPRPDYQPQIQVLPSEDLGPLVVNHPSNEYFRNLLINTVSYDPVEITRRIATPAPVVNQQSVPVPCPKTPTETKSGFQTLNDDVDILNNTIPTDGNSKNGSGGMIARIIDDSMDTSNATSAEDEDDSGNVEATTPRLEGENKPLNKTERVVTRRSSTQTSPPGVSSLPVRVQPRHYRRYVTRGNTAGPKYGDHDDDVSFEDDEGPDYNGYSSYSESDSYEDDNEHDEHNHDNHNTHSQHPLPNDRFLDDHQINDDLGDDLFRFDHKNTDHKVLNYQRADKTVRPHTK